MLFFSASPKENSKKSQDSGLGDEDLAASKPSADSYPPEQAEIPVSPAKNNMNNESLIKSEKTETKKSMSEKRKSDWFLMENTKIGSKNDKMTTLMTKYSSETAINRVTQLSLPKHVQVSNDFYSNLISKLK